MKWFDRWFKKKCIAAWESRDEPSEPEAVPYSNKVSRAGSVLVSSSEEEPWAMACVSMSNAYMVAQW